MLFQQALVLKNKIQVSKSKNFTFLLASCIIYYLLLSKLMGQNNTKFELF